MLNKDLNLLISIKSIDEVSSKYFNNVDILDLKNPSEGAIGSWEVDKILKIVKIYGKKIKISATTGEDRNPGIIKKKLEQFDKLGLDFIKFGLFANNQNEFDKLLNVLEVNKFKTELVPVVFADNSFLKKNMIKNILKIKNKGFKYILIDTYSKLSDNLMDLYNTKFLKKILKVSLENKIFVGLAGKLNTLHLPELVQLQPKIIGFRSAICKNNNRVSSLSIEKVNDLYYSILSSKRRAIHNAGA